MQPARRQPVVDMALSGQAFVPAEAEIQNVRRFMHLEALVFTRCWTEGVEDWRTCL